MLFHAGWNSTEALLPAPLPGDGGGSAAAGSVAPTATRVAMVLVVLAFLLVAYDRETLAPGRAHLQRGRTTE
ncbi:hypothetical protein ACFQH2_11315 [Natronoarchaeum sp. GCM10025703]|uniref:hypothetical protein n=1 Tax=unclassified Natronoarchaeum TaxID=2620183 RepID=UPI00360FC325